MGMSASQARLLSLTSRLSDLEFQAQGISNAKIRLADASADASKSYQDSLDKQVLTVMGGNSSNYVDATAYNLTTYGAVSKTDKQRFLKDSYGKLIISEGVYDSYTNAKSTTVSNDYYGCSNYSSASAYALASLGLSTPPTPANPTDLSAYNSLIAQWNSWNADKTTSADTLQNSGEALSQYLERMLGYSVEGGDLTTGGVVHKGSDATGLAYDADAVAYYTNIYNGAEGFYENQGTTSNANSSEYDKGALTHATNLLNEINECGASVVSSDNLNSSDWLYNQLSSGNIYLSEYSSGAGKDGKGDWVNVSWSSGDATLATESDKTGVAKAEAEYETTMAQIQSKDNRFDLELKQIDTEHQAIQTEMDSVKKVIDKNIERSFKIFDA